jgi:ankyrin repeat protein
VNATDHLEMAALHWAVRFNSSSTITKLLIRSGADVKQVASAFNGKTLLTTALEQCSETTAQLLLDAGACYDSLCLCEAVGQGLSTMVQWLLTCDTAGA